MSFGKKSAHEKKPHLFGAQNVVRGDAGLPGVHQLAPYDALHSLLHVRVLGMQHDDTVESFSKKIIYFYIVESFSKRSIYFYIKRIKHFFIVESFSKRIIYFLIILYTIFFIELSMHNIFLSVSWAYKQNNSGFILRKDDTFFKEMFFNQTLANLLQLLSSENSLIKI